MVPWCVVHAYFAGKLLEKVTETSGTVDWRHYVFAGSAPVALVSRQNSATTISYVLKDHLGSTSAFVNSAGTAQVNESFRAFGVERSPTDWVSNTSSADTTTIAGISRSGFTFESFSGMMVHLNGRVLDGFIGPVGAGVALADASLAVSGEATEGLRVPGVSLGALRVLGGVTTCTGAAITTYGG
jgi:hypothetical protein